MKRDELRLYLRNSDTLLEYTYPYLTTRSAFWETGQEFSRTFYFRRTAFSSAIITFGPHSILRQILQNSVFFFRQRIYGICRSNLNTRLASFLYCIQNKMTFCPVSYAYPKQNKSRQKKNYFLRKKVAGRVFLRNQNHYS